MRAVVQACREGRCLVALQGEGRRPPLYVVPGRRGDVMHYRRYVPHLGPDQPLYGLRPWGLGHGEAPDSRVEDMARRYLAEIRDLQRHGPYFVSGYCAGGSVAYEMAQQLAREGERVGLLLLLDSPNAWAAGRWRSSLRMDWVREELETATNRSFAAALRTLGRAARRVALGVLRKPFRARGRPLPRPLRYRSVADAIRDARDYRPVPYGGAMVLFRAALQWAGPGIDRELGWGGLVRGGVAVHDIPALHRDFVEGPRVPMIAQRVAQVLAEAQRQADPS